MAYRNNISPVTAIVFALALVLGGAACSVEKTQTGKAPDVDVDVDPGRWPRFNVNWADVDVGTTTRTVTVPKLEWTREQREIQVPYIDINPAGATDREEKTITVEVEVPNRGYNLQIKEIRAAGDQLWVISELTQAGAATAGSGRVSDQVVVNAPEDLNVRHVIVGQRPEGAYNQQYRFYPDMSAAHQRLPANGGRVIYQRGA